MKFLDSKRLVVSVEKGHAVFVHDVTDGAELARWEGHAASGYALAVSSCGKFVASGDEGGVVRLWTRRGRFIHQCGTLHWFQRCGGPLTFSSDSRWLAIRKRTDLFSWGDSLSLIDTQTFEQVSADWGQMGVNDLCFSSDGEQLFAACDFE